MSYPTTLAYWPGDTNPAYFQNLQYNSTTQELAIIPFGNTVDLTTPLPSSLMVNSITTNLLGISTALFLADALIGPKVATGVGLALNLLPAASVSTIDGVLNVGFSNAAVTMYNFASNGVTYWTVGKNTNNDSQYGIGADAGSNFKIDRLNPIGTVIDTPLVINHTDGTVEVPKLNVSSLSGVSTINGIATGVTQWINPAAAIQVSTVAGSSSIVPIVSISTIAGHSYRLSFEYGASNGGGGAATDVTELVMSGDGLSQGVFIDSWTAQQTYTNRYTTASGIQVANGNFITLNVNNPTASANVQVINGFRLWSEDIGFVTGQY